MRTAERLRYLILAAQREGNRRLAAELAPLGLTPAQSEALRILSENGPMSLRALGRMLVCDSGSSPSRIVERLVAAGLVERATDDDDHRQIVLSLSPLGVLRADEVAKVEGRLYDVLDVALEQADSEAILAFLQTFTRGSAAGAAFDRRFPAPPSPTRRSS